MVGEKRRVEEGGTRNFLAVKGPGVRRGLVSPHLAHVTDIFPTLRELAGGFANARTDGPLDGVSIANLIFGGEPTRRQSERVVVELDVTCSAEDFVPLLGPDRRTLKPQSLLDYDTGGSDGLGFKKCIGARYKDYKWLGKNDQLYLFEGGAHEEAPCSAVDDEAVRAKLAGAARRWWDSVVASPNAFERPVYYIGMPGRGSAAVLGTGPAERTPGRVSVLPVGLVGFSEPGDFAAWRVHVLAGGDFSLGIGLQANHKARFRLTMGTAEQTRASPAAAGPRSAAGAAARNANNAKGAAASAARNANNAKGASAAGAAPKSASNANGGAGGAAAAAAAAPPPPPPMRYEFDVDPAVASYTPDRAFSLPPTDPARPWEMRLEMVSTGRRGAPAVRTLKDVTFRPSGGRLTGYVPYDFDGDEGVGEWRDGNRDRIARLSSGSGGRGGGKRAALP